MDNIQAALDNYMMWIKNYPGDYAGATAAASDFLDTVEEVNEFESRLKAMIDGRAA